MAIWAAACDWSVIERLEFRNTLPAPKSLPMAICFVQVPSGLIRASQMCGFTRAARNAANPDLLRD